MKKTIKNEFVPANNAGNNYFAILPNTEDSRDAVKLLRKGLIPGLGLRLRCHGKMKEGIQRPYGGAAAKDTTHLRVIITHKKRQPTKREVQVSDLQSEIDHLDGIINTYIAQLKESKAKHMSLFQENHELMVKNDENIRRLVASVEDAAVTNRIANEEIDRLTMRLEQAHDVYKNLDREHTTAVNKLSLIKGVIDL